jgi:hypothetical protein
MYDYLMIFLFMFPPNDGLEKEPTSRFFYRGNFILHRKTM